MAVLVGAGVQAFELQNFASQHNITVATPHDTVGIAGGWIAAGGHGSLASKIGLGSDQVLSMNVVTADGQFLTVDPETNRDLWWALRGGGPSKLMDFTLSPQFTSQRLTCHRHLRCRHIRCHEGVPPYPLDLHLRLLLSQPQRNPSSTSSRPFPRRIPQSQRNRTHRRPLSQRHQHLPVPS